MCPKFCVVSISALEFLTRALSLSLSLSWCVQRATPSVSQTATAASLSIPTTRTRCSWVHCASTPWVGSKPPSTGMCVPYCVEVLFRVAPLLQCVHVPAQVLCPVPIEAGASWLLSARGSHRAVVRAAEMWRHVTLILTSIASPPPSSPAAAAAAAVEPPPPSTPHAVVVVAVAVSQSWHVPVPVLGAFCSR